MRPYLCDKIIAERHFDYLRSKKILTREDAEEISCRPSSRKKTGKLLDYLAENPKGLDTLIESIRRERTQNFLLEKITDVVLKVKNEKLEALKGELFNSKVEDILRTSVKSKSKELSCYPTIFLSFFYLIVGFQPLKPYLAGQGSPVRLVLKPQGASVESSVFYHANHIEMHKHKSELRYARGS